ncbi:MAG: hydrogenase maturation protease [Candidatus Limnocylindrales bacterium]
MPPAGLPVLVCGDPRRCDDGVALRAAAGLPRAARALADVRPVGQLDPQALLDAARPCIVVDAVVGVPAGTLVDMALGEVAQVGAPAPHSSHALPAAMVVGLAEAMGADLDGSRLIGVGIGDVRFGTELSPPVAAALPRLIEMLAVAIAELSSRPLVAGSAATADRSLATVPA